MYETSFTLVSKLLSWFMVFWIENQAVHPYSWNHSFMVSQFVFRFKMGRAHGAVSNVSNL